MSFGSYEPQPAGQNTHYNEYDDEEEVQMTFDTSYETPPRSARTSFIAPSNSLPQIPQIPTPEPQAQRPELKSSQTVPAMGIGMGMGSMSLDPQHNAWADEDEDFGVEKEIEMTFA